MLVTITPSISSSEDALRCITELEGKVRAWSSTGRMSAGELSSVEAALANLKGFVYRSRQSEALLRERVNGLERELEAVRNALSTAEASIKELSDRLEAVEKRDKPIAVREAMRELEKRVCMEAAGSKSKAKALFNFSRFDSHGDAADQARLKQVMARLSLSDDCVNALGFMKDLGDSATHDSRPSLPVSEWAGLLTAALRGSPFDGDAGIPEALLRALQSYVPAPADSAAPWGIRL